MFSKKHGPGLARQKKKDSANLESFRDELILFGNGRRCFWTFKKASDRRLADYNKRLSRQAGVQSRIHGQLTVAAISQSRRVPRHCGVDAGFAFVRIVRISLWVVARLCL